MKSRVKGDFQARFRENVGVKFPRVTRLYAILGDTLQTTNQTNEKNNHFDKNKRQ